MRVTISKSKWIELVEWCVLLLIGVLLVGVLAQRGELGSMVHGEYIAAEGIEE
jgi:hypothetical protein